MCCRYLTYKNKMGRLVNCLDASFSPEEVLIGGMKIIDCLSLIQGPALHAGWQERDDIIAKIGRASVCCGQDVDVSEPIRLFSSVLLTHKEDTENQ